MPKLWWGSWAWAKKRIADLEERLLVAECAVTTEREQREIAERKAARLRSGLDTVTLTFKDILKFFVEHPGCVMRASHIQNDATLPQQTAVVQVSGQGQSMRGGDWLIEESHSGHEESSNVLRIIKKAISFTFYDMYFYVRDLSPLETQLFSYAPQDLAFRIRRQQHWSS